MNVLLIEPDQTLGQAYQQGLSDSGMEVIWRRGAQTALDALDDTRFDLIVLEVQLGMHNGIEFLYELRSHADWAEIPVIVHTLNPALANDEFSKSLKNLGVIDVVYKPKSSIASLVRLSKRLVSKHAANHN